MECIFFQFTDCTRACTCALHGRGKIACVVIGGREMGVVWAGGGGLELVVVTGHTGLCVCGGMVIVGLCVCVWEVVCTL